MIRHSPHPLLAPLTGESHDIPWTTPDDLRWVPVLQGDVDETAAPAGCGELSYAILDCFS